MNLEIRKLTSELLEDWLYFFDNIAFSDNSEWSGCYCMYFHWNKTLQNEKEWDYSKSGAARNRKLAEEYIKKGLIQGYLAYYDGKVAGWCNANNKQVYDSVIVDLLLENSEKCKKIKAIVCFCIAPDLRGKGIATKFLEMLCSDAADDGYEYIEAYPFKQNNTNSFTGSISMYEIHGFKTYDDTNDFITVCRKYL